MLLDSNNGDGTWTVNLPVPDSNMEFLVVADGNSRKPNSRYG